MQRGANVMPGERPLGEGETEESIALDRPVTQREDLISSGKHPPDFEVANGQCSHGAPGRLSAHGGNCARDMRAPQDVALPETSRPHVASPPRASSDSGQDVEGPATKSPDPTSGTAGWEKGRSPPLLRTRRTRRGEAIARAQRRRGSDARRLARESGWLAIEVRFFSAKSGGIDRRRWQETENRRREREAEQSQAESSDGNGKKRGDAETESDTEQG